MQLNAHALSDFDFSQKAMERFIIVSSGRIPAKSKNILNRPVHFSRVLGDLIANKNIEYGSWYSISITFFLSPYYCNGILIKEQ
jgi:hypothetical protein